MGANGGGKPFATCSVHDHTPRLFSQCVRGTEGLIFCRSNPDMPWCRSIMVASPRAWLFRCMLRHPHFGEIPPASTRRPPGRSRVYLPRVLAKTHQSRPGCLVAGRCLVFAPFAPRKGRRQFFIQFGGSGGATYSCEPDREHHHKMLVEHRDRLRKWRCVSS